ncbi:MAG: hypothetical protein E7635_04295 [Ruminococcaceae bacterium]|nr:hypothetical protein [Oscillospiraceae bacterium]
MIYSLLTLFSNNVNTGESTNVNNDTAAADAAQTHDGINDEVNAEMPGTDTGENEIPDTAEGQMPAKTRREIYDEFIRAHKDLYAEDTQRIINRRFKEVKETEAALVAARERISELEAIQVQKTPCPPGEDFILAHPDFDLERELKNDTFKVLYNAGIDPALAYDTAHLDEIIATAKEGAHREAVRATFESVKARGVRIQESASASHSGISIKRDVSKLSRAERAEIARRVMAGEKVSFV